MRTPSRPNYRIEEVRAWIEDYEELREVRGTTPGRPLRTLLGLIDIDRAVTRLRPKERLAVLLCGQYGLTTRTAGVLTGVTAMTMSRRYRHGLERLTTYMNGGL